MIHYQKSVKMEYSRKRLALFTYKYFLWYFSVFSALTALAIYIQPMSIMIRIMIIIELTGLIFGFILYIIRQLKQNPAILILFLCTFIFLIWYLIGNGSESNDRNYNIIKSQYNTAVKDYIGVPYKLNGETKYGIDDSGIARCSLWQSILKYGISNRDWHLLIKVFPLFWWRDLSSKDILNQKYNYTDLIGYYKNISKIPPEKIRSGDIAYIIDDELLMVYIGNNKWVTSKENEKAKVINIRHNESDIRKNIILLRWWILEYNSQRKAKRN